MSVKVMGQVWDTDLDPNQKLMLLAYADAAEHDGTDIWPGAEEVERMTSYSRSQVQRLTTKLKAVGVLVQVSRGQKGRRAEFYIDLDHPTFSATQDATLNGPKNTTSEPSQAIPDDVSADSFSDAPMRPSQEPSATQDATLSNSFSDASEQFSDAPMRPLPSLPPVLEEVAADAMTGRDLVWEVLVEVHGEPATKSERGKLNRVRKILSEAEVDHLEYPHLVAAYMARYSKRGSGAPQPTAMTIAQRVGELRHFLDHGPIGAEPRRLPGTVKKPNRRDCTHENLGVFPSSDDLVEGICPACSKEFTTEEVSALLAGTKPNDEAAMADVVS